MGDPPWNWELGKWLLWNCYLAGNFRAKVNIVRARDHTSLTKTSFHICFLHFIFLPYPLNLRTHF